MFPMATVLESLILVRAVVATLSSVLWSLMRWLPVTKLCGSSYEGLVDNGSNSRPGRFPTTGVLLQCKFCPVAIYMYSKTTIVITVPLLIIHSLLIKVGTGSNSMRSAREYMLYAVIKHAVLRFSFGLWMYTVELSQVDYLSHQTIKEL